MTVNCVDLTISDVCRSNRGNDGAIDEALQRVREEYAELVKGWPVGKDAKFRVVLIFERPAKQIKATYTPTAAEDTQWLSKADEWIAEQLKDKVNGERWHWCTAANQIVVHRGCMECTPIDDIHARRAIAEYLRLESLKEK